MWPRLGQSRLAAGTSVHQCPGTSQGCYRDIRNVERQQDETGILRGTQTIARGSLVVNERLINGPPEGIRWTFCGTLLAVGCNH